MIPKKIEIKPYEFDKSKNLFILRRGDRVLYVPSHAAGDLNHPDVEHGEVFSKNATTIFVVFDEDGPNRIPKGCDPEDLRKL